MTEKEQDIKNKELQPETEAPVSDTKTQDCNSSADETKEATTEGTSESAEGKEGAPDNSAEGKEKANDGSPEDGTASDTTDAPSADEEPEQDPLEKALAEIEELKKQALYKQAEFDNYRKRTIKEKSELILNGGVKVITEILPVLDDFERAIQQAEKTDDVAALKEGMELIFKKFISILEKQGVKKIETAEKDFDTDFHEAIALVPGMGDAMKGKVIDCVQTGYTLNDKVIRHAKVAVGQ